jgi:hypothetical protein
LCLKRLEPSAGAETPLATAFHPTDAAKIVALTRGEIEEFLGNFCRDAVAAEIAGWDLRWMFSLGGCCVCKVISAVAYLAVSIPEITSHWRCAVEGERLFEDYQIMSAYNHLLVPI